MPLVGLWRMADGPHAAQIRSWVEQLVCIQVWFRSGWLTVSIPTSNCSALSRRVLQLPIEDQVRETVLKEIKEAVWVLLQSKPADFDWDTMSTATVFASLRENFSDAFISEQSVKAQVHKPLPRLWPTLL